MISIDRHGITNRTYEEDDEEECNTSRNTDLLNNLSLKLSINGIDSFDYTSINGFIFCTDFAALPCANSIIDSLGMIDFGTILNTNNNNNNNNKRDIEYGKLYYSKHHQILLVIIENEVPDYLIMTLVSLFNVFIMSYVILLNRVNMKSNHSIIPNNNTMQSTSPSTLYHMMTNTFNTAMLSKYSFDINLFFEKSFQNKQPLPHIPLGVILKGISAALFNYVYIRDIPSIMFIAITTEMFLNITTMKAFEMISPLLLAISNHNYHNNLNNNTTKNYQKFLKLDPYAIKTENLYC